MVFQLHESKAPIFYLLVSLGTLLTTSIMLTKQVAAQSLDMKRDLLRRAEHGVALRNARPPEEGFFYLQFAHRSPGATQYRKRNGRGTQIFGSSGNVTTAERTLRVAPRWN